ncbi:unnamed protein product [Schistosoma turkestanicum]|nr:unnamed protein product [Schistosoma turkestanicum]CAH8436182.1 unnamed protein product [Schistosoma turkestanicum]
MDSGIKCHSSCVLAYNDLKMNKKCRYLLFHIDNMEEIRLMKSAERDATLEDLRNDFKDAMNKNEGRYAVYDYEYPNKVSALVFVIWTPTTLSIKTNLIYAASMDAIKSQFQGIKHTLQAHDLDDISEENFKAKGQLK